MELKDIETIKEAVTYVDSLNDFQKAMLCGKVMRADEILSKEKEILDSMYEKGQGYHILGIVGTYAIIEANNEREEYPFVGAFCSDEKWKITDIHWDNMDSALLHAMGCKKEGSNSKFARYAYNMIKE